MSQNNQIHKVFALKHLNLQLSYLFTEGFNFNELLISKLIKKTT